MKDVEKAHEVITKSGTDAITAYAQAMTAARLNGTTGMAEDQAGYLHNTIQDYQHLLTKEQIAAAKNAGVGTATTSFKAIQAFKEAVGDPSKTASAYDAAADTFKYPSGDVDFAKQQDAMIHKLPDATIGILKSYTGSGYTTINKAAGAYGSAKMAGLNPEPLLSWQKNQIADMDEAFSQIKLGQNVALRRNMPQKYFWNQLGITTDKMDGMTQEQVEAFVGKTYKETAFGSASMNENFNSGFSGEMNKTGGMILRIRAAADTNAVRVASISGHDGEEEVVMGRGTTYVIRSIKKLGSGHKYRYEVFVDAIGTFPDAL
jgi:hypothetical protein